MKRTLTTTSILLLLFAVATGAGKFDLRGLDGQWEGTGSIAIAASPVSMDLDGTATFKWDSACGCLRTALSAEKFMLKYSDTGRMYHNSKTDRVSWDVWDNYGNHRRYMGKVDGDSLSGRARILSGMYDVTVRASHRDTLDIDFYYTDPDSVKQKTGYFKLWRKE